MTIRTLFRPATRPALPLLAALCASIIVTTGANAQPSEPQRIVAIGGAVTETLYALGVEDRIVAVDTTAVYPPQAKEKPNVGYMRALSAEGVLAQSPDLVLMEEGAGPPPAVALLQASGIAIETVPAGHGDTQVAAKIEMIAKAVGKADEGTALASEIEADLARLEGELAVIAPKKRVLFILSIIDGRPMAAGTDTAADAMVRLAGGENVLSGFHGYKTLSSEAATQLAPDVVVMMTGAGPDHGAVDPFAIPALKATPAGRAGALIRMDAAYLLGFGPRTARAARDLAAKFYPDQIAPSS